MTEQILNSINIYGYLAIFILVLFQETGLPNPFPNEILLILSGYLCHSGNLVVIFVILCAIAADLLGAGILFSLFYNAHAFIFHKILTRIPYPEKMIASFRKRIEEKGTALIFLFRLTPFTRGYVSVAVGLMRLRPVVYFPIIIITGCIWATFYVVLGWLAGSYIDVFTLNMKDFRYFILIAMLLFLIVWFIIRHFINKSQKVSETELTNK